MLWNFSLYMEKYPARDEIYETQVDLPWKYLNFPTNPLSSTYPHLRKI